MRILIVLSAPDIGGAETLVLDLVPRLDRIGCQVDIVNLRRDSAIKETALARCIRYSELSSTSRYIRIKDVLKIIGAVRQQQYDLVLGGGIRVGTLLRLLRPCSKGTPLIVPLTGLSDWYRWYHVMAERLTYPAVDLFVAISEAVAKRRSSRDGLPSDRVVVIPNGTDLDAFDRRRFRHVTRQSVGLPTNKVIVATVASLKPAKGLDFYLEAVRLYEQRFSDVQFIWVGCGPLGSALREEVKRARLGHKIRFLGSVPDVRPILACSDIFVLPSREEGMPRALMEAMSMSVACVATNVGGVGEVIEDGQSGLLVEFGDSPALAGRILDLVRDQRLRSQIARAARERIAASFSLERTTAAYATCFRMVMAGMRDAQEIQRRIDGHLGLEKVDVGG